ncbi:MAG: TolB family protein [Myxococcota bacterium]
MPRTLRHLPALLLLAAPFCAPAGCGAGDEGAGMVAPDDVPGGPDMGPLPATDPDAASGADADAAADGDTGPGPDAEEVGPQGPSGKPDDDFLVPPEEGHRSHAALSDRWAAWVERDGPGGAPRLVAWDLESPDPPRTLAEPNLVAPRDLVLGEGWLFYVDVRYGDPDVFAIRLSDGARRTVVAVQGAQEQPTARGSVVAWRDCRGCVGGGEEAAELYRRDVNGGDAERLTDDDVDDRLPSFGTLADGTPALAWVSGDDTLRVRSAGGASSAALPRPPALASFTAGLLAWRASPLIINPDSMHPGDVLATDVVAGTTTALTSGVVIEEGLAAGPTAAAGRVAWLESAPGPPVERRLRVADPAGGAVALTLEVPGAESPVLAGDRLVFLAPRDDNGGLPDVWIRDL